MEAIITVIIVLLVCIVIWYISTPIARIPQNIQSESQHVQNEACCIPEQHCSEQHACGKETILRGRGSKASGCEDEFLTK